MKGMKGMTTVNRDDLLHPRYDRVREASYLALDVDNWEQANQLVSLFGEAVDGYKVGLQLFHGDGARVLEHLNRLGKRVFLDVKLHDIPNTVAGALRAICQHNIEMVNVHASGGRKMLEAARRAVDDSGQSGQSGQSGANESSNASKPLLIAVTALTSLSDDALQEIGYRMAAKELVLRLAALTAESGLDGVVASAEELPGIRANWPQSSFEVVVPGTRLPGGDLHDQVRTLSPGEAVRLGASRLVIGRAVTLSTEPVKALQNVWENMLG